MAAHIMKHRIYYWVNGGWDPKCGSWHSFVTNTWLCQVHSRNMQMTDYHSANYILQKTPKAHACIFSLSCVMFHISINYTYINLHFSTDMFCCVCTAHPHATCIFDREKQRFFLKQFSKWSILNVNLETQSFLEMIMQQLVFCMQTF